MLEADWRGGGGESHRHPDNSSTSPCGASASGQAGRDTGSPSETIVDPSDQHHGRQPAPHSGYPCAFARSAALVRARASSGAEG